MIEKLSRREVMTGTLKTAALLGALQFFNKDVYSADAAEKYKDAFARLDAFVLQYMTVMNSPGMTVAIANRNGLVRHSVYGFGDLEQKLPVLETQLFEIGSITKSFVGLLCMQLVEEGKLDLRTPVIEYLPWLRLKSDHPITTHHLLTHSSGLPGNPPVFLSDPAAKHECRFVPGEAFHYCNMGYAILGHLITTLDGMEWNEALRRAHLSTAGHERVRTAHHERIPPPAREELLHIL